jgi:hypothetical protein
MTAVMDELGMTAFVDRAVANAERAFGHAAPPTVLEQYAREAALDLWMVHSGATVALADLVGRRIRAALTPRPLREEALAAD